MSSFTGESRSLWKESPSSQKTLGRSTDKVRSDQVINQVKFGSESAPCAEPFFSEEHSDDASTTGSDQDLLDDSSAVGSEQSLDKDQGYDMTYSGLADESPVLGESPRGAKKDIALPPEVYSATEVSFDARPTFTQRLDGSFVMELPSVNLEINTACFATVPLPRETDFRPRIDACVALPEVQLLVFDPLARTPAGMCMAASAHKCVKVLEVPYGHDLSAKICTKSTSGSQTLKERLYTNGCQNMNADVVLNFELRANANVSTSNNQLVLEIDVAFKCWLSDSAIGYLHEGEWWGLVLTQSTDEVLSKAISTDYQLSYIERRVREIYDTLSSADLCTLSASCLTLLKAELAQLERNAEVCEGNMLHDVCPDELQSGGQIDDGAQKSMLRRFKKLYQRLDKAHHKALDIKQGI